VIVADMTPEEGAPFEAAAADAGLAVVYLVAPTTRPERRAAIAARSGGFLYCVSLVGVTGARSTLARRVSRLVREVKAVSPVPVAVGFGVSRPEHVRSIAKAGGDGVVVASALVDALGPDGRDVERMARLVRSSGRRPRPRPDVSSRVPKSKKVTVGVEVTRKKAFASALDWPGWSRAGKTPEDAVAALAAYVDRYAAVAKRAKLDFPFDASVQFDVAEATDGQRLDRVRLPEIRFRPTAGARPRRTAISSLRSSTRPGRASTGSSPGLLRSCARVRVGAGATGTRSSSMSSGPMADTHACSA
jgi:tryptophan synthase alpha chain